MLKIRRKTILFLSVTTLAIILCIWGFEYVVSIKKSNAEMIKVLHQQSALSQRISKFIYRIRIDFINDSLAVQKTDSLFVLLSKWKLNHSWLVTNNRKYTGSENVISNCDSLLEKSTSRINGLITVAKKYLANTGEDHIVEAATTVDSLESEYDSFIRQCMDHYEQDESDLASLIYFLPYAIGVFVVFILVIGYLIFVNPLLEEFRKGNADLVDVNSVLAAKTNELYEKLVEINALQESLYVSEKNYRELVENVSDIIYELNDSGKFIFINKGAEQITGFTREEFLQKHFWEIFPREQSQALVDDLLQLMKNMALTAYRELPIVSKSNSIIWIGQNITFQYGEGKRLEKVKVVARDITLLREVEQKLKDSESLFRLLSENSTDIICLHEATDDANYNFHITVREDNSRVRSGRVDWEKSILHYAGRGCGVNQADG